MSRGYEQRCVDRLERLRRRAAFLQTRIEREPDRERGHDKGELSALRWVLEEIELLGIVADVLNSDQTDAEKLAILRTVLRSRCGPDRQPAERDVHADRPLRGDPPAPE